MKYILFLILILFPLTTKAVTYATWDSGNCDASMGLSGGNLIITKSTSAWKGCKGTINPSTGKWYWEVTITNWGGTGTRIGTANTSETITGFHGNNSTLYADTGDLVQNGGVLWSGTSFVEGDILGFALDADASPETLKVYKNNSLQGLVTDLVGDGNYPYVTTFDSGDIMTANFGATTLTYTPPSGYCAGLADSCGSESATTTCGTASITFADLVPSCYLYGTNAACQIVCMASTTLAQSAVIGGLGFGAILLFLISLVISLWMWRLFMR